MRDLKTRLQGANVLVVGDAMLDRYLFGEVERISPEAPVPVVRVTREEDRLGGAANVALNVRSLGAQATLITAVGVDEAGGKLKRLLASKGVQAVLGEDPQVCTCVKLRVIGRAQQLLRVDFENRPDHEILADMLSAFTDVMPECSAVLFSDYGKGGLTHISRMIALARAAGKPILVDPKGADYSRYAGATVVTPNRLELSQAIGTWQTELELREKAQRLREEHGLEALLLTRSDEGMTLFDADGDMNVPAQAREVFDVTGAGDTVIATMAAMLACGMTLREAASVANRAAGIVVGKFGTATVSCEELFA